MDLSTSRNMLLRRMDEDARSLIEPLCESVDLRTKQVLYESGAAIEHIYFPEGGLHSYIALAGNHQIEVAHVGREGMTGLPALSGSFRSPCRVLVQASGTARRVPAHLFFEFLEDCPSAKSLIMLYQEAFAMQLQQTALANGIFNLEQRLARWLLMCHDRLESDNLEITHELISIMLGVRRAGVTSALHMLEGNHLIRSVRGLVTIRDRAGLERVAGHSYGVAEEVYEKLLGTSDEEHSIIPGRVTRMPEHVEHFAV